MVLHRTVVKRVLEQYEDVESGKAFYIRRQPTSTASDNLLVQILYSCVSLSIGA